MKVILITGGSRGIGLGIVHKFKEMGWKVATCATHLSRLKGNPADLSLVCDVSKPNEIKNCIEEVHNKFGRLDALVNNAGLAGENSMDPSSSDETWHRLIDVNLNGTYYASKHAIPYLPTDGSGRIVNIASVLALKGAPDHIGYCAAKHAVLGFTRALALHLAPKKITVNAICPGWTRTDMAFQRFSEIGLSEKDLKSSVPLQRFIEPEEIAETAYFLIGTPGGQMITGQSLTIDGGVLA